MDTKPWYTSKTVWGGLLAVGSAAAASAGYAIDPDMQDQLSNLIVVGIGAVGGVLAIFGRIKAGKTIK